MSGYSKQGARGLVLARAADAMLRSLGGGEITLRLAGVNSQPLAEFGIAQVAAAEVVLSPAVVRRSDGKGATEVLVSATAVDAAVEAQQWAGADQMFQCIVGLVLNERAWKLESVATDTFSGVTYLYRMRLVERN